MKDPVSFQALHEALKCINHESTDWMDSEVQIAVKVLYKYANCVRNKLPVPTPIFEAHNHGTKTINSDIAVFDLRGKVYLVGREPGQLWADTIHLPGTTHCYEWLQEATERLLASELRDFNLKFENLERIGVIELQDEPRAMCQSNLFKAVIQEIPPGKERMFFVKDDIPWDQVVFSHRTVTLPWLIDNGHFG